MPRVGINDQLRIWNTVRQIGRVHSGNHDVVITVYDQRGYLDAAEILWLLPAPGVNRLQLPHEGARRWIFVSIFLTLLQAI